MRAETIFFCGPIPASGAAPGGGYEASNQRTIAALRGEGWTVQECPYPQPRGGIRAKILGYLRGFRSLGQQIERGASGAADHRAVLHVTGLYKQFLPVEWWLLRKGRAAGMKTVYDVRAGSMLKHYQSRGSLYRWAFRALLREADQVMVEGLEYQGFMREVRGKDAFYLPNHIDVSHVDERPSQSATTGTLTLCYAGRITEEKGIATLLDAAQELCRRGLSTRVLVAGPGEPELLSDLQRRYASLDVEWLGSLHTHEVLTLFGNAHFFVFPTRHSGEGHSNALTEAMAMACVPVAASNGFNASVIADAGLVLPIEADGLAYAQGIQTLWQGGRWAELSALARQRVLENYATEPVISRLSNEYRMLLGD